MQKKLLLICVVLNGMIQASQPDADYSEYIHQKTIAYQTALIKALSGEGKAIEDEDQKSMQENEQEAKTNEQAHKEEEENQKKQYYDGEPGYWGSKPTNNSKVGRKFEEYAQQRAAKDTENSTRKEKKNKIVQDISQETIQKRNIFNEKVLPEVRRKLESKRFFIHEDRLSVLRDCRENLPCYGEDGLSSTIFTNPHFGTEYETKLYKSLVVFSTKHNVRLTVEELKNIAEHNSLTKKFFKEFKDGIEQISTERDEIERSLNAQLDIKENQNDQGALSQ